MKKERIHIKNAVNKWNALVGIHDRDEDDEWNTIFGEPLSSTGYKHWAEINDVKQPDNGRGWGKERCGAITPGAIGYNDVSCFGQFAFFCER